MSKKYGREQFHDEEHSLVSPAGVAVPLTFPPRQYCPHLPTYKQTAFLFCPRQEVFFGGAAGPGKTDALLMAALQLVESSALPRPPSTTHLPPAQPVQLHHESCAAMAGE